MKDLALAAKEQKKEGSKALFKELGDEANKQGAKC